MGTSYMSDDEIRQVAADLLPLLDEVLEYNSLDAVDGARVEIYTPPPIVPRIIKRAARQLKLRDKNDRFKRSSVFLPCVTFTDPDDKFVEGAVVVIDDYIAIATQYQSIRNRPSRIYIAHDLVDYIKLCLADRYIANRAQALVHIDNLRYALERRLPDGHSMKRPQRESKEEKKDVEPEAS